MISWGRVVEIVRKELHQTLREPRARALLFAPPIIQLVIFGYAVNMDVVEVRLGWFDLDRTSASRELQAEFDGSRYFRVVAHIVSPGGVTELLDKGEVDAVISLNPGYGADIARRRTAQVQLIVDGTDSNTAAIVSSYASQLVSRYSRDLILEQFRRRSGTALSAPAGEASIFESRPRVWFNAELRSQDFFVPGVVVNIITLVTVMLTAMAIVREKEIGTMEQLMVTPIRPVELMLGKTLPFALVGLIEVALVTSAALLIFGIPFRGSSGLLVVCSAIFLLTTLGLGLLISTVSGTQQQAMMGSFFFFAPAFMLSGFTFPIQNMPVAVQYLTYLNPLRYFLEIVRGIFLKGVGLEVLWPQIAALGVIGVGVVMLSTLQFRQRVD